MEKYGFVYVWMDKKYPRFYVGCHWGYEDDGYICSSNWMSTTYKRRPKDFKRRIVTRIYTSRQDLLTEEHRWLSLIPDEELGKRYYNISKHHFGHWSSDEAKAETTKKKLQGRQLTEEQKDHLRQINLGKKASPESKAKVSAALKGRPKTAEHAAKVGAAQKGKINPFRGIPRPPEVIEKMKAWHKNRPPISDETREKMAAAKRGKPGNRLGKFKAK